MLNRFSISLSLQFYNKVLVPLVTLYVDEDDGTVPELLGSTQTVVMEALDNAGVEIELDARKLYAKGKTACGSSQETSIAGNATNTRQYQSQTQETPPPPRKVLGVSGARSMAKKPGGAQKTTRQLMN